jgi:hypothetical protein
VRALCVRELIVRRIDEVFEGSGSSEGIGDPSKPISGERRGLVEMYYASLDWSKYTDANTFLNAVGLILAPMNVPENQKGELGKVCVTHGLEVEAVTVRFPANRSNSGIRNIIFASTGLKPQIVMADALTNSIKVISDSGDTLTYDRPILDDGLSWHALVDWWKEKSQSSHQDVSDLANDLYNRLSQSLASEPERPLFRTYCFKVCGGLLGELPALLP